MAMAISCALARLRRNGLADLPSDLYFEQLCAACGQKWRERLLAPLLTLKLFLLQIVHGNTPTILANPDQHTPEIRDNRCNVDTGAGANGALSAAIFNDRQPAPIHTISTF